MLPVTVGVMSSCVKAELRDGLKDACASCGEILACIVRKTLVSLFGMFNDRSIPD